MELHASSGDVSFANTSPYHGKYETNISIHVTETCFPNDLYIY